MCCFFLKLFVLFKDETNSKVSSSSYSSEEESIALVNPIKNAKSVKKVKGKSAQASRVPDIQEVKEIEILEVKGMVTRSLGYTTEPQGSEQKHVKSGNLFDSDDEDLTFTTTKDATVRESQKTLKQIEAALKSTCSDEPDSKILFFLDLVDENNVTQEPIRVSLLEVLFSLLFHSFFFFWGLFFLNV